MELETVMRTTFAAREFLDEPVSDEQLFRILDTARFAPSGGNRQGWRVIVVKDPDKRAKLRELIVPTFKRYIAQVKLGESPWNTITPTKVTSEQVEAARLPRGFVDRITEAPVVLLVFVDLRVVASMDQYLDRVGVISGASIYPFVWNILLAARNEGLGGTLTTFAAAREPELQEIFGVPSYMAACAMLPIGKPTKQLTKLSRKPVQEFTTIDDFAGPVLERREDGPAIEPGL